MVNTVSITRIRTLGILVACWLGLGLMLTESSAQQIGLFYHSDYVQIEDGNIFAEGSNLNASIEMLGHEMNLINEFTASNILESDLIIIPELERKNLYLDLKESQKQQLRNYVSNGGGLIISGVVAPNEANAKNATDMLNGVFNFSIKTSEVALTGHSVKGSQGNEMGFSNAPDKIPNNNSVAFITDGLPASSISVYSDINNEGHSSVTILSYGEGKIIYLGWGWWNAMPNGTQDGGWMSILEAAINIASCPNPELNIIGQKQIFNLDSSKEVIIDALDLPLDINTCTEDYEVQLSKNSFDCDNLGEHEVEVTLVDKIGRKVTKTILIEILDQNDHCRSAPSFINLQGSVKTIDGKPLQSVKVNLKGENSFDTNSDSNGRFQIADIPTASAYQLKAIKDSQYLNGVSTYDMVLISKHINGLINFNQPFQFIAADVNNSGTVTIKDVVELRDLILYQTTSFENQDSWQIINNQIDLSDPLSQSVDKTITYAIGSIVQNIEFTGIKIGDINASADPSRRTPVKEQVVIEDLWITKGETIRIPIKLKSAHIVEGFQLGFQFENQAFKINSVNSEMKGFSSANFNQTENELLISWINNDNQEYSNDLNICLDITANKNGKLSNFLSLINRTFNSEIYDQELNLIDLELEYIEVSEEKITAQNSQFQVYNSPNPFKEFTEINFEVFEAAKVVLEVYNVEGKLILSKSKNFDKGMQKIIINDQEINNPGLYYYSIIQRDNQKTTNTLIKY